MLLIHGTQPDADVWGPTFSTLAQHTRVIAYDRRGFSRSTAAASPDYRTHAADAAALLEHLGATPRMESGECRRLEREGDTHPTAQLGEDIDGRGRLAPGEYDRHALVFRRQCFA